MQFVSVFPHTKHCITKCRNLCSKKQEIMKTTNLKKLAKVETWVSAFAIVLSILSGTNLYAQSSPEKVDVNISTDNGGGGWYAQPWVWVVGVALFIIVIVAITRSGSRREV
jgi:hypothetical protein